MPTETHILTFPVHPTTSVAPAQVDWRRRWQYESDSFANALGPRQGVHRIVLDHDQGTVTVEFDPDYFSLDQLKALGTEMGLVVGGAVYHTILDFPKCGRRAALADELQNHLQTIPGVARAAVNPAGRTLTVEYIVTEVKAPAAIMDSIRALGFQVRDFRLPEGWWDRNQLAVYSALCAVTLALGYAAEHFWHAPAWLWTALYVAAYLSGGTEAAINGFNALRQRQIDVDFLMVAAAVGAAIIGDWGEGGMLLFLFSLSNALQKYAMDRTRQAIRALMNLRPATARVRRDGALATLPVEELEIGDVIEVRPGERLPADGEILAGQSAIDQSPITGESIPVPRGPADPVYAGSINGGGALDIRVNKRAQDSTLARIITLVEEAQSERAPTQKRLDEFEQKYAVGVLSLTALVAIGLPLLGWPLGTAFYKAMTVMVVASPCALVISTPASILSAIAAGARHGVLFKGGAHVESLGGVKVVAFDKTGTLTLGKPRVTDILPLAPDFPENELLSLAAAVEAKSEHPLARAVVTAARDHRLDILDTTNLQAVAGKGVTAHVAHHDRYVHIGTAEFMRSLNVTVPDAVLQQVTALEEHGRTVMLVADTELRGLIAVADIVRPEAPAAVAALKAVGVQKVVMLTGDNRRAAQAMGAAAGVDEVRAELLPEDKVAEVKRLLKEYGSVAMVGDGVNDAPALAAATVGIAMGAGGTDVALETADVVLMASDLSKLPYAFSLSHEAMRVVKQNLTFAIGVIMILIPSALFNLIILSMGVLGHEGSTVIVVLNGLRLLGHRPKTK